MKWPPLIQHVVPPPRGSVGVRAALPLVVFLAAFGAICWGLDAFDLLLFSRPAYLGLIVVSVWIWWMHVAGFSGLSHGRGLAALGSRLLLCAAFVMLLAEPRAVRTQDVLSVIYAVDVSDSVHEEAAAKGLEFVARTVYEKPSGDEAGLLVFGRNAAVEYPPNKSLPMEGSVVLNTLIDRDATNLERALSLSAAMLPEEHRGRIVLISDGAQTEGSLNAVLDELKARGISVDVLPIRYTYDREVWLERLELPQSVKIGENYQAAVVISSLHAGKGVLTLRENGTEIARLDLEFPAGKSRHVIPLLLREPGYYEYTATISVAPEDDSQPKNNQVVNYIFVEGEGRTLLVVNPEDDPRTWQALEQALQEGKRSVTRIDPLSLPRDTLSLMPYDAIIFNNAAADAFDAVQLQAVHDAVRDLGIGFLMVGGPDSFGPGGYHRTVIEDALPVDMDVSKRKVLPKGALVIVLHTCEFAQGNTWGKRITKEAIKVLGARDEVGVLVFDFTKGVNWLFELTPASEYEKLVPRINAAEIGDMPDFASTMQLGLEGLMKSDAAAKHMIIISDGDPSPPSPQLINDFKTQKISISTVSIFPHGGNDISLMQALASSTGGRYYAPRDSSLLPAIFIKESKTLQRTMIQNKTIQPQRDFDPQNILRGIEGVPRLHGYVLTTLKEDFKANSLLVAPEDPSSPGERDPILAVGRYGLGETAAFTSDLSTNWGADWVEWESYRAFVQQLMTQISRSQRLGHLRLSTYTTGNEGVIVAEDFHPEDRFLEVTARVSGPREQAETLPLRQVGPRRYQAEFPLWGKGQYQVLAKGETGDDSETALAGFIVPYSPEYLRFRADPILLSEIAERTGGRMLDPDARGDDIYRTNRAPKQSSRPVFDWFLIALAILLPLDVGIRRIQLDWAAIRIWLGLGSAAGTSTQTMGALLERKQAVAEQLSQASGEGSSGTPEPRLSETRGRPPSRAPSQPAQTHRAGSESSKPATGAGGNDSESPLSTTERLLQMKRKRDQENK